MVLASSFPFLFNLNNYLMTLPAFVTDVSHPMRSQCQGSGLDSEGIFPFQPETTVLSSSSPPLPSDLPTHSLNCFSQNEAGLRPPDSAIRRGLL